MCVDRGAPTEELIKIGAKVLKYAWDVTFQVAEPAVLAVQRKVAPWRFAEHVGPAFQPVRSLLSQGDRLESRSHMRISQTLRCTVSYQPAVTVPTGRNRRHHRRHRRVSTDPPLPHR